MHVPWQEYGRLFICILIKGEIWGHTTSLTPPTFVLYAFNQPGKWAVMYLCVRGINFASLYDFDISFWIVPPEFFTISSIQIKSIPINLKRYIIFTIIVNVFPNCLSLKIPYLHINLAKQIVDWHAETLLRPVKSTSYKLYYRYKETSLRHTKVAFNYKYVFCHLMTWHLSVASSNRYNDKVIYKIWLNKIMFSRVLNAK
jgi:hypothetical protein